MSRSSAAIANLLSAKKPTAFDRMKASEVSSLARKKGKVKDSTGGCVLRRVPLTAQRMA